MDNDDGFTENRTLVPVPDPTERTEKQLMRELASQKELIFARIDGMDKVFDARFKTIDIQFLNAETARDLALAAVRDAAILQSEANKAAFIESKSVTAKQLDQLQALITNAVNANVDKIDDLKDRFNRVEGRSGGVESSERRQHDNTGTLIALGAALIAAVTAIGVFMKPAPAVIAVPPIVAH